MGADRAIDRWIALEMGRMQQALVTAPRAVGDLVLEEVPSARTRGGDAHVFDRAALARAHAALSPLLRRRVRVPVTFYVDKEVPDDASVADEGGIELLRALGEIAPDASPRDGRLWLGRARAQAIAQRHPTLFQFVLS